VRLLDAGKTPMLNGRKSRVFVLHIDPIGERSARWCAYGPHLARAKWMARHGYLSFKLWVAEGRNSDSLI